MQSPLHGMVLIIALTVVVTVLAPSAGADSGKAPAMADFETLNFRGAAACSPCHSSCGSPANQMPHLSSPPMMVDQWSSSVMSHGAVDPFWQAKVRSEVLRAPHIREVIEGKCATCHTPMAATEARFAGDPVLLFEDGFLSSDHELHLAAMAGISCTVCHRIEDSETLGSDQGFSGYYTIEPVASPEDRILYGPYAYAFDRPMLSSVGLRSQFGDQINDSALCATCHNLKTPFLDANGDIAGTDFPEQMPFGEWQQSDLAGLEEPIGCQQCHLPIRDEGRIANSPLWLAPRERASHEFVSANTAIMGLLAEEKALLGSDPAPLLAAIDAGRDLLTRAGRLQVLNASIDNGVLEFSLRVENSTGHKLPTAFPSRRVFLHAVVIDAAGQVVFESGAEMADGRIAGVDSDDDPGTYEPHHQTITSADQVQVYEAILGTTDDAVTTTLLRAARYLKDNRIVPAGFDPTTVPEDIWSEGACMTDPDFGLGRDEITYRIDGLAGSAYRVSVELRHQTMGHPYVADLREHSSDPVVSRFLALYDAVQPGSELIAEIEFDIGS